MGKVLIVEDTDDVRQVISDIVKTEGYSVFTAENGAEAIAALEGNVVDLVFLDIGLPDVNGIELIPTIRKLGRDVEIVMLTSNNDARSAVNSLKAGAVDYILKPFELIEFKNILNRLMVNRMSLRQARVDSRSSGRTADLLGNSRKMLRLKEDIATAAAVKAPVLITGETGTGKELVARALHFHGGKGNGVFVKVDCGTLAANIIESELFGHEKGAFTGAAGARTGLVELADGGTLFLDEIGNLPLELQPKLLRLIEEYTFRRVGGSKDIRVNVRVVAATNDDVVEMCRQGRFREDLYYRLNVVNLRIPPLRDREQDVLQLADHYLHHFAGEMKKNVKGFTPEAEEMLLAHDWPGNVRELKNFLERSVIYCKGERISIVGLDGAVGEIRDNIFGNQPVTLKVMEENYIRHILKSAGNNKSMAARILGISRTTLRDKINK